jgi:trimethylamine:corrinoid methyltransferase-like protein
VHGLATDFAVILLGQLVRKGCFCMGSSDIVFMDPASGALGGFSQTLLAELAKGQIGRLLDLPLGNGHAGKARCRGFGPDTVAQASLTMMHAFHSRPSACSYLGLVDGGISYSLRTLLLCHDLVGLVRRQWQGVRVDDEMLALDVSRAVGPRGDYLAHPHTADHCRTERWPSRYFERRNAKDMEEAGESDLLERVDADLRDLLASHWAEPLPDAVRERMNSILEKYGAAPLA